MDPRSNTPASKRNSSRVYPCSVSSRPPHPPPHTHTHSRHIPTDTVRVSASTREHTERHPPAERCADAAAAAAAPRRLGVRSLARTSFCDVRGATPLSSSSSRRRSRRTRPECPQRQANTSTDAHSQTIPFGVRASAAGARRDRNNNTAVANRPNRCPKCPRGVYRASVCVRVCVGAVLCVVIVDVSIYFRYTVVGLSVDPRDTSAPVPLHGRAPSERRVCEMNDRVSVCSVCLCPWCDCLWPINNNQKHTTHSHTLTYSSASHTTCCCFCCMHMHACMHATLAADATDFACCRWRVRGALRVWRACACVSVCVRNVWFEESVCVTDDGDDDDDYCNHMCSAQRCRELCGW